jgi:hypothetical protein
MLKLTSTLLIAAGLSAVTLFAAPATTNGNPILTGHGNWEIPGGTVGFQVSVVELPDGSFNGHGVSTLHGATGNAWFHFEVVEAFPVGEAIGVIGIITDTHNTPPHWEGAWNALVIQDNGNGGGPDDRAFSAAGAPSSLPIEVVRAFVLGTAGPPEDWFAVTGGNFTVH